MRHPVLFAACAAVAAAAVPVPLAAAQDAPQVMGEFEAWRAMKANRSEGLVCYVMASPQETEPKNVKRDPIFFLVSNFPGAGVKGEPQIVIGYPFQDGSKATVEIGGDKFAFETQNSGTDGAAWLPDRATEQKLVAAMRDGSNMTVRGTSRRGTNTKDTYSLRGISAALDAIENCQ